MRTVLGEKPHLILLRIAPLVARLALVAAARWIGPSGAAALSLEADGIAWQAIAFGRSLAGQYHGRKGWRRGVRPQSFGMI